MLDATKKNLQKVGNNMESAYPEIREIGNDIQSLKSNVGDLASHIKNDGLSDVSKIATEKYKNIKAYGAKLEEQVKERPAQSMAIAFAGGLLASLLLSRR